MNERKILFFILAVIIYCMYSVHMWFIKQNVEANVEVSENKAEPAIASQFGTKNQTQPIKQNLKAKVIPLFMKDACSVLEVFTQKPPAKSKRTRKQEELSTDNNTVTVIGITVFLIVLLINAILDAIQAKEDERARRKLNPDGERRQSLAEFANKKPLRRESSRYGLQLFQIAESFVNTTEEEKKTTRRQVPYTRGDSINSYLSEPHRKSQDGSAPASINETPAGEPRLVKRQSVAKLFGARPVPMIRRSSFPALPQNPEVQALMLGHRQQSVDSDDESDGKGRRVRLIRRF